MLALEYLATNPSGIVSVTLASPVITTASWAADGKALLTTLPDSIQRIIATHEAAGTTSSPEYQTAAMEFMLKYVFGMTPPFPPEADSAVAGYNPAVYETMWGPSEFSPTGNLRSFDRSATLAGLTVPVLFTAGRNDEARPGNGRALRQDRQGRRGSDLREERPHDHAHGAGGLRGRPPGLPPAPRPQMTPRAVRAA